MFGPGFRLTRVWGIPINVDYFLILLLLYWVFPDLLSADWDGVASTLTVAVLFFASIALHELGHSFVAIRKGCRVRQITLTIIGGAAQMERIPERPRDEFQMAIAGPLVSVAIGVIGFFGHRHISALGLPMLGGAVQFVGYMNFVLALFNLVPSFPMDGGRVLRSLLAPRLGRLRATLVAARIGKFIAVAFGVYGFIESRWSLLLIAVFVFISAGAEYRMVLQEELLRRQGAGFGFNLWSPSSYDDHPQDISRDVEVGPAPFEEDSNPGSRGGWLGRWFRR
jgi:Zn-dependent protease